jgi:hypothetical protein
METIDEFFRSSVPALNNPLMMTEEYEEWWKVFYNHLRQTINRCKEIILANGRVINTPETVRAALALLELGKFSNIARVSESGTNVISAAGDWIWRVPGEQYVMDHDINKTLRDEMYRRKREFYTEFNELPESLKRRFGKNDFFLSPKVRRVPQLVASVEEATPVTTPRSSPKKSVGWSV